MSPYPLLPRSELGPRQLDLDWSEGLTIMSIIAPPRFQCNSEGNIGVCGVAVLANFLCGISVILTLIRSVTVFSKPAECVFLAFWSKIVGIKT